MADSRFQMNDLFWKVFEYLENLKNAKEIDSIAFDLGIKQSQLEDILKVLTGVGQDFSYEFVSSKIRPSVKSRKVQFEMSPSQWLAFQSVFSDLVHKTSASYAYKMVSSKFAEVESVYPDLNFYQFEKEIEGYHESLSALEADHLKNLELFESSLKDQKVIQFKIGPNCIELYPHKIVYLDGKLTVIGEDADDRCLVAFPIENIKGIKATENKTYRQNYSSYEIDDFISGMRTVSGREERLILKILKPERIVLNPPYHFMGGPYMTSNSHGESIWAASVEPSQELFKWLFKFKESFEILDPDSIKSEFKKYCQSQEIKELKKVS